MSALRHETKVDRPCIGCLVCPKTFCSFDNAGSRNMAGATSAPKNCE